MRTTLSILAAWLLLGARSPLSAQTLRIYHIDVDQGAATLFVTPGGRTLLVDSGKDGHGTRIRAVMQQAGASQIDHFVATHYHEDHFGGIDELRAAPAITIAHAYDRGDTLFVPADRRAKPTFRAYQAAVGRFAEALTRGETIPLDPAMTVTCISAGGAVLSEQNPPPPGNDENDMSVSLLITFGDFRYFIGGDIETPTETKIAARDLVMDVDMYEADHHGADNGSSAAFLSDLRPTVIVISNGSNATYEHPRQTTLNRMAALSPRPAVFQTNKYLRTGDAGGNVADSLIADLESRDADGTILVTVNPATGAFIVTYRHQSHTFQVKQRPPATRVVIASLLPDPVDSDSDREEVTLRNAGAAAVALTGWVLRDTSGRVWALTSLGTLAAGQATAIRRNGMPMTLNNNGDEIVLLDSGGAEQDRFRYTSSQEGVPITTGH